jgi:hypothetical protein
VNWNWPEEISVAVPGVILLFAGKNWLGTARTDPATPGVLV